MVLKLEFECLKDPLNFKKFRVIASVNRTNLVEKGLNASVFFAGKNVMATNNVVRQGGERHRCKIKLDRLAVLRFIRLGFEQCCKILQCYAF